MPPLTSKIASMPGRSDGELAREAQAGDRQAFELLLERFLPRVRAFLYRLGGGRGSPDDLTQEVFLVAIRRLSDLREPERFGVWLFGIAVRIHRGRGRHDADRRGRVGTSFDVELERLAAPDPLARLVEDEDVRIAVLAALERLSDRHREAFLLRHVEGLSPEEVAQALGSPEGTARRWVFEARERLRELLRPRGIGARGSTDLRPKDEA